MTRPLIDTIWEPVCNLSNFITVSKTVDKVYPHNALVWNGKLWIFCGQGAGGTGHVVNILSYNLTTGVLIEEYNSAVGIGSGCIWRTGVIFNDVLYAAFTGQVGGPVRNGSVWKFNSTGSMTKVMDTKNFSAPAGGIGQWGILALCVHNGKIWAGGGAVTDEVENGTYEATLYSSSDGTNWNLEYVFYPYDYIRGLVSWNGELWVGMRAPGALYRYSGGNGIKVNTFPSEVLYQAKELIVYNNKLYIGCVNTALPSFAAKVYSTKDGITFKTEINMSLDHEIFHGDVVNGKLYFATRTNDSPTGGAVICTDGQNWREVYRDTGQVFSHIHFVKGSGGVLYMSGSNLASKDTFLYRSRNTRPLV